METFEERQRRIAQMGMNQPFRQPQQAPAMAPAQPPVFAPSSGGALDMRQYYPQPPAPYAPGTHPMDVARDNYANDMRAAGPARPQTTGEKISRFIGSALLPAAIGGLAGGSLGDAAIYGIGTASDTYSKHKAKIQDIDRQIAAVDLGLPTAKQQYDTGIINQAVQHRAAGAPYPNTGSTAAKMAGELGLKPGTHEYNDFIRKYANKPGISMNVNMNDGAVPLGKPVINATQKEMIQFTDNIGKLGRIAEQYESDYLTYGEQWGNAMNALLERGGRDLSEEDKNALSDFTKFKGNVQRFFLAYRKATTGVAGGEKEMEDIKKATLNMEMSPTQFKATWGELNNDLNRALRLRNGLMRKGFTDPYSEEANKAFAQLFEYGMDDDGDAQLEYLMKEHGMSEEDAADLMIKQGY